MHFYDQFFETLTDRGVSRVNYEVPRLSKLHEDARRCFKDFQQVWVQVWSCSKCATMTCRARKFVIYPMNICYLKTPSPPRGETGTVIFLLINRVSSMRIFSDKIVQKVNFGQKMKKT